MQADFRALLSSLLTGAILIIVVTATAVPDAVVAGTAAAATAVVTFGVVLALYVDLVREKNS